MILLLVGGIEVDRDDQVAVAGHHRHDRQRVEDAAVDQHAIALHHWRKQAGDGRRGAHGLVQATLLKPDFLLVGEVGGNRRVGDAQLFDVDLADDLADLPEHLVATNGAEAKAHVHQAQYIQVVEALDPVAVVLQLASGVDAANYRTHGAAGDAGDVVAPALDFLNNANVGISPGAARSQYQCHAFTHEHSSGRATMVLQCTLGGLCFNVDRAELL